MRCNCEVGIVYLTSQLRSESDSPSANGVIDLGNRLVRQADRREESFIEESNRRQMATEEASLERLQ